MPPPPPPPSARPGSTVPVGRWVLPPRSEPPAALRLFCLPYAGGGASVFRDWPKLLPSQIAVYPVQLPGREAHVREKPFSQAGPLAQALAEHLQPYLDVPFALFGHSMGAVVAFELARQLRRHYRLTPTYLIVAGRRAPQLPNRETPIYQLPDAAFLEEVQRRYNAIPDVVRANPELLALFLPGLRGDFTLLDTYACTPEEPLACPVAALGGEKDPDVTADDLQAWRTQTSGPFTWNMLPGGHFFVNTARDQVVRVVTEALTKQ